MTHSFRYHILNAIGTGVTCRRPFSNIKLLQLLGHDQVGQVKERPSKGDLLYRLGHDGNCLIDAGTDNEDTLMSIMDDADLKKELEDLVHDAEERRIVTLKEKTEVSLMGLIPLVFLKDVEAIETQMRSIDLEEVKNSPALMAKLEKKVGIELAKVVKGYAGLKRMSDKEILYKVVPEGNKLAWCWEGWRKKSDRDNAQRQNTMDMSLSDFLAMLTSLPRSGFIKEVGMGWTVSVNSKRIMRRAVSHHKLGKYYRSPDLHLDLERHMGVVTAIYFIRGELTFEGDANAIAKAGLDSPTTTAPFDFDAIAERWDCSVSDTGTVVVKQNNPAEWIVAIEYRDVATEKEAAEFVLRSRIFIDPPVS
jgi:hypothetical protein